MKIRKVFNHLMKNLSLALFILAILHPTLQWILQLATEQELTYRILSFLFFLVTFLPLSPIGRYGVFLAHFVTALFDWCLFVWDCTTDKCFGGFNNPLGVTILIQMFGMSALLIVLLILRKCGKYDFSHRLGEELQNSSYGFQARKEHLIRELKEIESEVEIERV
jgi:hypothetical protein